MSNYIPAKIEVWGMRVGSPIRMPPSFPQVGENRPNAIAL
jgi:hypothetical protein